MKLNNEIGWNFPYEKSCEFGYSTPVLYHSRMSCPRILLSDTLAPDILSSDILVPKTARDPSLPPKIHLCSFLARRKFHQWRYYDRLYKICLWWRWGWWWWWWQCWRWSCRRTTWRFLLFSAFEDHSWEHSHYRKINTSRRENVNWRFYILFRYILFIAHAFDF